MVMKDLILYSFYFAQGVVVLQRTEFIIVSTLGRVWWSSKN